MNTKKVALFIFLFPATLRIKSMEYNYQSIAAGFVRNLTPPHDTADIISYNFCGFMLTALGVHLLNHETDPESDIFTYQYYIGAHYAIGAIAGYASHCTAKKVAPHIASTSLFVTHKTIDLINYLENKLLR